MGLFFNKKNKEEKVVSNSFLEDQKSVFDTEGEIEKKVFNDVYDDYIYKPQNYDDIPKYQASSERPDVVVDKEELGYEDLNPEIRTVNIQKKNLHADLQELVDNGYIDDDTHTQGTSIYDDKINDIIKKDEDIEVLEIDNTMDTIVSEVVEEDIDKSKKLSIFGNSDEPIQAKVYGVKEVPKIEKLEIVEPVIKEEKKELEEEKRPEYCPQCGAPLAPHAETCFLCGNKI